MREVRDVRWARMLGAKPACIPSGRPRGVRARGVKFESACAAVFPEAAHGVWLEYEDASGHGFAQVDLLWRRQGGVVVGEAKLTWRREAYVQLRRLYFPLLRVALGTAVAGLVLCRNLTRETPAAEVVGELPEAFARSACGGVIPVLHLPLLGA